MLKMRSEELPKVPPAVEPWAIPLALLWSELVFKASTTGDFWPQIIFVAFFSVAAGMIAHVALSLVTAKQANKICTVVLLAVTGVVFCVEYFVYCQFKLFYDLNTVFAGAGDAATGFTGQILSLVFSLSGIVHIVLFLAPAIAYGIFFEGEDLRSITSDTVSARGRMLRDAATVQIAGLLLVACIGTFGQTYGDHYNFQSAVSSFGLVTGVRKDAQAWLSGARDLSFSNDPTKSEAKDEPAPEPVSFEPNQLPIDFAALAETTEGTMADLDRYVDSLTPSLKNGMTGRFEGYNLIFVTAEALSAEAIREDTTPTLWRMANNGIQFTDYYQFDTAGTTGGECGNILGLLPTEGGSSLKLTATHNNYLTMGSALNRLGYNGWAFHNNTYTYYDRDQTHNNLGYSNGFMGYGNGIEQWVTWQWPQSDLEMVRGTFDDVYGSHENEPFNIYYMSVSGHSGYAPGENAMSLKHWDAVADLPYSDRVKGYLACNIELDEAMGWLVDRLEQTGMADHTLIVIGADHFPYGLDDDGALGQLPYTSELYGYDVLNGFERDHNRLIIWTPSLEQAEPLVVSTPTSTVDILPTLLNLFGCEWDSRLLPGRDVFSNKTPLVFTLGYDWKTDLGTYFAGSGEFIPNEGATIPEGYVEAVNADVENRINYCRGVLTTDYYQHVFGDD